MGGIGLADDGARRILDGIDSAVKLSVPVGIMLVGPVIAGGDAIKGAVTLGFTLPVAEGTPAPVPVASIPEVIAGTPEDPVGSGTAVAVPVMAPVRSVPVMRGEATAKPLAPVPVGAGLVVSVEPPFGFGIPVIVPEADSVGNGMPVVSVGTVTIPVMS